MNKLSDSQKDHIICRLIYGELLFKINNVPYRLVNPDIRTKVLANDIYKETIKKNRFYSNWFTDAQCLSILVKSNLCSPNIDENLKEISKRIDDLKVELFESMFDLKKLKDTRKMLEMVRTKQNSMISTRHMLDHLTLTGYSEMVKRQYIIFNTLYYDDTNDRVWNNWEDVDMRTMEIVMSESISNIISAQHIREIARTEPWKSIWNASSGKPFNINPSNMTEEQRAIILYSQMYENIGKHPECPSDDVLQDDDLLDGWMIKEKRNREKEQMDKHINDKLGGRHKTADELFIVPRDEYGNISKEVAKRIHDMNDTGSKIVKAQRENLIKKQGLVRDAEFLDRQLQIQTDSNQLFKERVKGRK